MQTVIHDEHSVASRITHVIILVFTLYIPDPSSTDDDLTLDASSMDMASHVGSPG